MRKINSMLLALLVSSNIAAKVSADDHKPAAKANSVTTSSGFVEHEIIFDYYSEALRIRNIFPMNLIMLTTRSRSSKTKNKIEVNDVHWEQII